MRYCCVCATLLLAGALWGQAQERKYVTYGSDLNRGRVATRSRSEATTGSGSSGTEQIQTLNGRTAPAETVEENVLSEGPNGRVVERVVQRYDQQGRPSGTERIRIEEQHGPGGESVVTESVYRTDINGRSTLQERSTTRTSTSGGTTNTTTETQRRGLNGTFQVVERTTSAERALGDGTQKTTSTWRPDVNGGFTEQQRETTEVRTAGDTETETTTVYDSARGQMEFVEQSVTSTEKHDDGSETSETSIYGAAGMGSSITGDTSRPVLREQQLVEREPGSDGSMVERVSYRSASISNSGRMEPYRLVRETVCTGSCQEEPEPAEQASPEPSATETEPATRSEVPEVQTVGAAAGQTGAPAAAGQTQP